MASLSFWQQLDSMAHEYAEASRKERVSSRKKAVSSQEPPAPPVRTPMTELEWKLVQGIHGSVTFPVGHSHKRFIRGLTADSLLSEGGRRYLAYIAHRYRRQYQATAAEAAWIAEWKSY